MSSILARGVINQNPIGMIVMWNKTDPIPRNWHECDGTLGTPDLRGKFLKQVPDNVTNPGALGGVATVTLDLTTLGAHIHGTITNSHNHRFDITTDSASPDTPRIQGSGSLPSFGDTFSELVKVVDPMQFEGGDGAHNNIPQFNDSFYIQRLK